MVALIIVLVLAVGGVGYYVWHAKKATENTLNNTSNSIGEPSKSTKKTAPTSQSTVTSKKYLEIKELGIKFELTDSIADAYYYIDPKVPDVATLSITSLKGTDQCGADKVGIGHVSKGLKTDKYGETNDTFEKLAQTGGKVIGNYAYVYFGPQAACSDNQQTEAKALATQKEFVKQMSTIQAL